MRPGRLRIAVIGAGAVGAVLGSGWRAAEHEVVAVTAVSEASKERAEALLPGVPIMDPDAAARAADLVLFALPDDILPDMVAGLARAGVFRSGQIIAHTSGPLGLDVLAPAREAGAVGIALHPAMSFTGTSMDLGRLRESVFAVTAEPVYMPIAQALVVELGAEPVVVEDTARPVLHAGLAHASAHVHTALAQAAQMVGEAGVPEPERFLRSLVPAAADQALAGGADSLQGSLAAGQMEPARAHLRALADLVRERPELGDLLQAYREMAVATVRRATRQGRLSEDKSGKMIAELTLIVP